MKTWQAAGSTSIRGTNRVLDASSVELGTLKIRKTYLSFIVDIFNEGDDCWRKAHIVQLLNIFESVQDHRVSWLVIEVVEELPRLVMEEREIGALHRLRVRRLLIKMLMVLTLLAYYRALNF